MDDGINRVAVPSGAPRRTEQDPGRIIGRLQIAPKTTLITALMT